MLVIRRFAEEVANLCNGIDIPGITHVLISQEAIAAGVYGDRFGAPTTSL